MGALEDYINQMEAEAQAVKAKAYAGIESGYGGMESYLQEAKRNFYGSAPSQEEQMRLKQQQIKDQYIQATQEMRDRQQPGYVSPEIPLQMSAPSAPVQAPVARDSFYIYPEDQARNAEIQRQLQAGTQSPYGLGTVNMAGGGTPIGKVSAVPPDIADYLSQFGQSTPQPIGPRVPEGFQYQEPSTPVAPAAAPVAISVATAPQPGQMQGPPVPEMPAGWQPSTTGPEVLSLETLASLTPQERFAVAQGYTPELAQAASAPDFRTQVAEQQSQETASPLIPELGETPQNTRQKRVLSMPSAVNSAYEQVLANAPKDLQPMFRAIRDSNTQKVQARREAANIVMQRVEAQRQEEHNQIDVGEKDAAEAGMLQYGAVQHEIKRDRAIADKNAEIAKAHLSVQGLDKETAAEYLKQAREDINEKYKEKVAQFDSTPAYKNAMEAKAKMQEGIGKQKNLESQIQTLTGYLQRGEKQKAAEFARATVAQTVNSLSGPNAIQTTEMLIRYSSLLDGVMRQELTGKWLGGSLMAKLAKGIYSKEDADKIQQEVSKNPDKFANILKTALESNPEAFLRTTVDTANANAKSINSQLNEFVIKPTSKKAAGVEYLNDNLNPEVIPVTAKSRFDFKPEAQAIIDRIKGKR